jgi:Tol biopolymer transport system component
MRNIRRLCIASMALAAGWTGAFAAPGQGAYPGRDGQIAFQPFNAGAGEGNPDSGLWVLDPSGSGRRRLRGIPKDAGYPVFSPNGRHFAYVYGSPPTQVFIADSQGHHIRRLTHLRGDGADTNKPTWSPDGRRLAFTFSRTGSDSSIAVIGADGSHFHVIFRGFALSPVWSTRDRIAFVTLGGSVWTMDPNGAHRRRLTHPSGALADDHPNWAPDGKHLLFDRTSSADPNITITNIYEIGAAGGRLMRLTGPGGFQAEPAWAPDGKEIVYVSDQGLGHSNQLWLMRANGSRPRQVTTIRAAPDFPDWQPIR